MKWIKIRAFRLLKVCAYWWLRVKIHSTITGINFLGAFDLTPKSILILNNSSCIINSDRSEANGKENSWHENHFGQFILRDADEGYPKYSIEIAKMNMKLTIAIF